MNAAKLRRIERQNRGADVAAHLRVVTGLAHQMRDQRGGGRFSVGAGDGDEWRARRMTSAFATEQFNVADDFDTGILRQLYSPVRSRMRERHAGRQNECGKIFPRYIAQICSFETRRRGLGHFLRAVVTGDHVCTTGLQGMTACKSRPAQAEYRDGLACEGRDGNQKPTSASRSRDRRAPTSPTRSRTGSRSAVRSSPTARSDDGLAPS